jgi:Ca2+-binding EF-hand superfamily protein
MRSISKALAVAAVSMCVFAVPAANAAEEALNADLFVKMCDSDKDGMVSKAEFMKAVEKMFDKQDTKKQGKLDKKQTEALLKELMRGGGGA